MIKKYIFLDFDGVLNTQRHINALQLQQLPTTDANGLPLFDPEAVAHLGEIIAATGAEVVISSTWKMEGMRAMRQLWRDRKMPGQLIDLTPDALMVSYSSTHKDEEWFGQACRGMEIDEWLTCNAPTPPYRYLILDDIPDILYRQRHHFIEINDQVGITAADVARAVEILNG